MQSLTKNGIELLFKEDQFDRVALQVLDFQQLNSIYTITLSDGEKKAKCNLGSGLESQIIGGIIKKNCIVKISEHSLTRAGQSIIPTILKLSVTSQPDQVIGNPELRTNDIIFSSQVRDSSLITGNSVASNITNISKLSIYLQGKWSIKATIIRLGETRNFNSQNGTGKVCSIDLADSTGEIRLTLFTESIDKFYSILEEGKVYIISNGKIQHRNAKFNKTNHPFEISSTPSTTITLAEDQNTVTKQHFEFVSLNNVELLPDGSSCDVIGVISEIEELQKNLVSKKTGQPLSKRYLIISDRSAPDNRRKDLKITTWGDRAEKVSFNVGDIVALKRGKVMIYSNNIELTLAVDSQFVLDPQCPEAEELSKWDPNSEEKNLSSNLNKINSTPTESVYEGTPLSALSENHKYAVIHGVAKKIFAKNVNELMYKCCPSEKCGKKLIEKDDAFFCPKCNIIRENFLWNYNVSVSIGDYSAGHIVTLFSNSAETLLGKSAEELHKYLSKQSDEEALQKYLAEHINIPYEFVVRWSQQDDKTRIVVNALRPIRVKSSIRTLLDQIKKEVN